MGKHDLDEREVYAKTIWAEARGEPEEGQRWVAWVIKNRANRPTSQWPNSIKGVCLQDWQFECWNGKDDITVASEKDAYDRIKRLTDEIHGADPSQDPTGGADHYNNPSKETASWVQNVKEVKRIGGHVFYKQ